MTAARAVLRSLRALRAARASGAGSPDVVRTAPTTSTKVCSFQLPEVSSFRLPLTHETGGPTARRPAGIKTRCSSRSCSARATALTGRFGCASGPPRRAMSGRCARDGGRTGRFQGAMPGRPCRHRRDFDAGSAFHCGGDDGLEHRVHPAARPTPSSRRTCAPAVLRRHARPVRPSAAMEPPACNGSPRTGTGQWTPKGAIRRRVPRTRAATREPRALAQARDPVRRAPQRRPLLHGKPNMDRGARDTERAPPRLPRSWQRRAAGTLGRRSTAQPWSKAVDAPDRAFAGWRRRAPRRRRGGVGSRCGPAGRIRCTVGPGRRHGHGSKARPFQSSR